jgi:hypothetical protein
MEVARRFDLAETVATSVRRRISGLFRPPERRPQRLALACWVREGVGHSCPAGNTTAIFHGGYFPPMTRGVTSDGAARGPDFQIAGPWKSGPLLTPP